MFLNSENIDLFVRFLWAGLLFGLFYIFCKFIIRLARRNVYITNLVLFCYWLLFGGTFAYYSISYYNYSFCIFGLFGMVLGFILVKISIDFLFTKLAKFIYNKFSKSKKRKKIDVKLRTDEKN